MSIEVKLKDGFIQSHIEGYLNYNLIIEHLQEIELIAEKTEVLRELLDATECEGLSMHPDQVKAEVNLGFQTPVRMSRYRVAFLGTNALHYIISKSFNVIHQNAKHDIELKFFEDRTTALDWLLQD